MSTKKERFTFYDCIDAGCEVSESESDRYQSQVIAAIYAARPDADPWVQIIPTNLRSRIVAADGSEPEDLRDIPQAVWEAGEFWD